MAAGCLVTPAGAEEASSLGPPPFEIRAQFGFVPLYGGDATVGSVHTWLPSVGAGYRLGVVERRMVVEAAFAHVGQDHDPYNRAPAFTFWGALLRYALLRSGEKGIEPFLSVGIGRLRVDAEEIVCEPPECFAEGGPNFVDGTFTTIVFGGGAVWALTRWGAVRGDIRWYVPMPPDGAADSDNGRLELAAGVVLRL